MANFRSRRRRGICRAALGSSRIHGGGRTFISPSLRRVTRPEGALVAVVRSRWCGRTTWNAQQLCAFGQPRRSFLHASAGACARRAAIVTFQPLEAPLRRVGGNGAREPVLQHLLPHSNPRRALPPASSAAGTTRSGVILEHIATRTRRAPPAAHLAVALAAAQGGRRPHHQRLGSPASPSRICSQLGSPWQDRRAVHR
jgi:hypothetical protein